MIRHHVFIKYLPETSETEKQSIHAALAGLKSRLAGLVEVHAGSNVSPEAGMDKGFGDGFVIDFADASSRDAYLVDPEHVEIGKRIVAAAAGGVDGIFVYDIETRET